MALFTRAGDVSGIDSTDFVSNVLVGNVDRHPEVTTGMVATGEQAFYDPMLTPAAASPPGVAATVPGTDATPTTAPTVTSSTTTPTPPAAPISTAAAGTTTTTPSASESAGTPAQTAATDHPAASQTADQQNAADHAAPGQGDATQVADQSGIAQTATASADSQTTGTTQDDQAGGQQVTTDPAACHSGQHGAGDQHQTDAAAQHHPGDAFHFATLTSDSGEHHVLMVGESAPLDATLTELQDLHLPGIDLGSIVQDWQHSLHHDWHMPG